MKSFKEFLADKTIGLIEPIEIFMSRGMEFGTYSAKVDSGNDGYNVLNAPELEVKDEIAYFKTLNGKKVGVKVVEYIDVHIGDDNIDHRPVVYLSVRFNNKHHDGVKFSLANRESNDNPVLISKEFIKKLGLLIDVNK